MCSAVSTASYTGPPSVGYCVTTVPLNERSISPEHNIAKNSNWNNTFRDSTSQVREFSLPDKPLPWPNQPITFNHMTPDNNDIVIGVRQSCIAVARSDCSSVYSSASKAERAKAILQAPIVDPSVLFDRGTASKEIKTYRGASPFHVCLFNDSLDINP